MNYQKLTRGSNTNLNNHTQTSIYRKRAENKLLSSLETCTFCKNEHKNVSTKIMYRIYMREHLTHVTRLLASKLTHSCKASGTWQNAHGEESAYGRVPGKGKTHEWKCHLTWGDRNWGTWARRLGWDELRGCTGGCCGCCMVLACAAPLLPNIPRLPLGIYSRTRQTLAFKDITQHITWKLLICAVFILSD